MQGRVSSIQSMGTLDGPGVRFVAFLQGCPLRCSCCHNPETWNPDGGTLFSANALFKKAERCRLYFGEKGGVTLSGGEPLMQPGFAAAFFALCKENGIHTCLDTSGCLWNAEIEALLSLTDYVLLDIKYPNDVLYQKFVGCKMDAPLHFLAELEQRQIPTVLRQVIIPGLSDTPESMELLAKLQAKHTCVEKIELLPFRKICTSKYASLGIPFPFAEIPTPSRADIKALESFFENE